MRIPVRDMTEMTAYLKRNKGLIFRIIHYRIQQHMDTNIDSIYLFEFLLTDYQFVVQNVAYRSEWITSLELGIKYFEETEEYEMCIEFTKTIEQLKSRGKLLPMA